MLKSMKILLLSLVLVASLAGSTRADCPVGDLNRDSKVNLLDVALLAGNWLEEGTLPHGVVVINEVMAHSHDPAPDWIELYNTAGAPIDIGGWYLSDSDSPLKKYKIADGTTIGANDYIVFYEDANFGEGSGDPCCLIPFALSENGESVYLSFGLDGELAGSCDDRKFGASETGVSFGWYIASTGVHFVAMDYNTPGTANAYPKVAPIVINEIMYHPESGNQDEEYVELYNVSDANVTLYDYDTNEPWKFTDGIEFTFPADTNIPAEGYLMVVKDKTAFTEAYGSPGVQALGPYGGRLSDAGENVEISMPGDLADPCDPGTRCYIRIDNVSYSDGGHHHNFPALDPWPTGPDGMDYVSLSRIDPCDYGNDVVNWDENVPSPGVANP